MKGPRANLLDRFGNPHPHAADICEEYKANVAKSTISKKYHTSAERISLILAAAGIHEVPHTRTLDNRNGEDRLHLPIGLLRLIPNVRFVPRRYQARLAQMFESSSYKTDQLFTLFRDACFGLQSPEYIFSEEWARSANE